MSDINGLNILEIIGRIERLNEGMREFWGNAHGWAPIDAAELMSRSRLDWQVSLSNCLRLWVDNSNGAADEGKLILAWVNLGSLVEGSMKLFLSVYYDTYRNDLSNFRDRAGDVIDPDILELEKLRQFFRKHDLFPEFNDWILDVQQKRNAVHAFRNRNIGTQDEFLDAIRSYLSFIREINYRLPYPDDIYIPREE